ncbi:hypothetical protein NQ314_011731 [Rhamnusium bicolor]|uniref:Uncharacterized protein n=1 Tax=Rhamnusium bicolor TaxID=1586634 RepID=A0AAV8XFL3_9CUCU|nr:hypothetical protein NQ314_011731 [Rhamnusium bicolor]
MPTLNTVIIFASMLVASTRCYVITNEDPVFPTQEILNDNSFIRRLPNQDFKIVKCPPGTYLDKTSQICQFSNFNANSQVFESENCNSGRQNSDAVPNPKSCR